MTIYIIQNLVYKNAEKYPELSRVSNVSYAANFTPSHVFILYITERNSLVFLAFNTQNHLTVLYQT